MIIKSKATPLRAAFQFALLFKKTQIIDMIGAAILMGGGPAVAQALEALE